MSETEIKEKALEITKQLEGLNYKDIRSIIFEIINIADECCDLSISSSQGSGLARVTEPPLV